MAEQPPLVLAGGSGFVGRSLVARLAESWNGEVRVWGRRSPSDLPPAARFDPVDLREREAVERAMPPGGLVVNLAYSRTGGREENLRMAANLAAACVRRAVARLVHVSTAVVVGPTPQRWVTETTPCLPVDDYQRTKLAIEAQLGHLAAMVPALVILRPTAVFGPGGANLRRLVRDLLQGSRRVNYLRSSLYGRRAMNLVPVETVAAAIEFALRRPRQPGGELFVVGDDEAPENNFRDVERRLLGALGQRDYRLPPLPIPLWCLETLLRLQGRLVLRPAARFSSARLRAAGFVPPVDLGEALERYARRAAGELAGASR